MRTWDYSLFSLGRMCWSLIYIDIFQTGCGICQKVGEYWAIKFYLFVFQFYTRL